MRLGEDAVFRYGGEEFLVVLTHASPDLAWTIAERIRNAVEALGIVNPGLHPADDSDGVVTISLGVAFAHEGAAPETVAKWADESLYDAKRSGRNVVFLSNATRRRLPRAQPAPRLSHAQRGPKGGHVPAQRSIS